MIEWLIHKLKKNGTSIATIKHTRKKISLDKKGKDSWRHREAGSQLTSLVSPIGINYLLEEEKNLEQVLEDIKKISDPDLILVEGYKDEIIPSIAVGDIRKREGTFFRYRGDREKAIEEIKGEMKLQGIKSQLGGLDCGECGFPNCRALAKKIMKGEKEITDCPVINKDEVKMSVNGESIALKGFIQKMIKNTFLGMISSLKGIDKNVEEVTLNINNSKE